MTTNSQLFPTTPAAAGRLHLKAAGILDGAWCAKNETKVCHSSSHPVVFCEKGDACNFIKKRLRHRRFPVNFDKLLRTPFL